VYTSESLTEDLDAMLQSLDRNCQVEEPESTSGVPAAAVIRQVRSTAATRPLVLPLIQQQTCCNRTAITLITAIPEVQTILVTRLSLVEAQHVESAVKRNEIAVARWGVLSLVHELLRRVTGKEGDIAQSIRELNKLAETLAPLQGSLNSDKVAYS
jgi:hypothetical protein